MRKLYLLLFLNLILIPAIAQKINLDSLVKIALLHTVKTNPVHTANRDSLFKKLTGAKLEADRINLSYQLIGYGEEVTKNNLQYHYKIIKWAAQNHDDVINSIISAELGYDIFQNGDKATGLKTGIDALNLALKSGNQQAIGVAYDNIGSMYGENGDDKTSYSYLQKALSKSLAAHDYLYAGFELENLGDLYFNSLKLDSAKYYYDKSFEDAVVHHIQSRVPEGLLNLANVEQSDQLRLKYFKAAEAVAERTHNQEGIRDACGYLGSYFKNRDLDSALIYAKKSFLLAKNTSIFKQIEPAKLVSEIFRKANADSALKYADIYYALRDSVSNIEKIQKANIIALDEQKRQQEIAAQKAADEDNLWLYILVIMVGFLLLLAFIFWRNNSRNKKAYRLLQSQKAQIQNTLQELKVTQTQLIQSEKMASLGELTAGIAHEIQNPLNFINNFSDVNREIIDELKEELTTGNVDEALLLIPGLQQNEEKINYHGKRADAIVKGMLEHSRTHKSDKQPTNINALADEFLKLSYHGLRAKDKTFNTEMITHFDPALPKINVIAQDMGRMLLNLFNNAFYTVNQKKKALGAEYKPEVRVSTRLEKGQVIITVKDNGNGIPDAIREKIMQPFFTTKPSGEGTGLGLSLSYDIIVKGHGGHININSKEGEGSEFIVTLPIN